MEGPRASSDGDPAPGRARSTPGGVGPRSDAAGRDRWPALLLGAALVVGLVRFVRLGEWSLWLDEALALADSLHGDLGSYDNPLGYLLFRWFFALGDARPDEWTLRFLPAVFGWLVLPLTYWAFRPFAGGRAAGAAALLLAVSAWHVYWSQNARFYTLAQAISVGGAGLYLRGLWRDSVPRLLAGLGTSALAALAHPSAAFLLPAQVIAPWLLRAGRVRVPGGAGRTGRVLAAAALLGGPLGLLAFREAWRLWLAKKGVASPAHLLLTTGFYVTPLLGAGCLVGALHALRARAPFGCLATAVVVLVVGEALAASLFARVSAQYVFVLLPWLALLAVLPLAAVPAPAGGRASVPRLAGPAYLALLVLPALTTVGLYLTVRAGERPPWREAYRFVWNARRPDDLVLGMHAPVGEYYLDPTCTDVRDQRRLAYLDTWRARTTDQWARYDRRIWLVVNLEELQDWSGEDRERLLETLRTECRLVRAFPLVVESRDLSVWVYLRE